MATLAGAQQEQPSVSEEESSEPVTQTSTDLEEPAFDFQANNEDDDARNEDEDVTSSGSDSPKPKMLSTEAALSPALSGNSDSNASPAVATRTSKSKIRRDRTEQQRKLDKEWGDSDLDLLDEDEEERKEIATAKSTLKDENGFLAQGGESAAGPVIWMIDKGLDLVKQEMQRLRKASLKITNESSTWILVNPHWAFKDGKTEINPDYMINKGHSGEALFQGHTLKGILTYEIAKRENPKNEMSPLKSTEYVFVVIFKVLYFRGFEIRLFNLDVDTDRKNQVGIKVVKADKAKLHDITIPKGGLYRRHKACLKYCVGHFHCIDPVRVSKDAKDPKMVVRFSISDTGESDIKVFIEDA